MTASTLIVDNQDIIQEAGKRGPILDLACGSGRNGKFLVEHGLSVVFADRQQSSLDEIGRALGSSDLCSLWTVDFEPEAGNPLVGQRFAAILVFRYLHRPLMPAIREAIDPGGLLVYETFTIEQPRFGRPKNPDFLLRPGELEDMFGDWDILHSFEGVTASETSDKEQAIARIVARKP